ncbi:MAG: hypothetical protein GY835_27930 [bacterium]|nr:hypothetical protein [bacterium]
MHTAIRLALLLALSPGIVLGQSSGSGRGAWMNPDIGFAFDLKTDLHDAERDEAGEKIWTTRGFNISTAELSLGAEIDPYGRIDFNAQFSEEGAEIHELYFAIHSLPGNLKLRGGHYLATFGRWSTFHSHAMPFASEPRILREYIGGHLAPTGVELSWLAPLSRYVELTGGVYNAIVGHSHDTDPVSSTAAWGPDNPPPGCHFHGDDLHCPDNPELEAEYLAQVEDPDAPIAPGVNKRLEDLALLGRLQSSLELGLSWSVDFGASVVHQANHAYSQRFPGETYAKTVYGGNVTVFWNPPEKNLYTGLDFGIEFLGNRQAFEVEEGGVWSRETLTRDGLFGHARYRLNRTWQLGAFGERFEPLRYGDDPRLRYGAFLTFNISHYQFVRLEVSRYELNPNSDPVHRLVLQYDGVIGYHTHGRQR